MAAKKACQLLVEGKDDKFSVIGLLRSHIPWPDGNYPVFIDAVGGVEKILHAEYLRVKMKESGLEVLGIMIDANGESEARWESLCSFCKHAMPDLPGALPEEGLITRTSSGLRFEFWMMPDCQSSGMLETFLQYLVPVNAMPLWEHARRSFAEAIRLGANCRNTHHDKALIHTWLAWQDPPGQPPGLALTQKILDPHASLAQPFVNWFRGLYNL